MSKQDGRGRVVTAERIDDPAAHILHVDLDAFFASVELLDRPDLRDKPVVVGHRGARSVVTAANYVARRYGVNSAMPMAIALRRCPNAIVLEPHYEQYARYSREVMEILRSVTPMVEVLGIDEAFLDVAGARRLFGAPFDVATLIRRRVLEQTRLSCSIGVASTKFVAKLASSKAKPDGLLVVPHAETLAFLHPQPISALWGVGAKSEERLRSRGLATVGDLASTPVETLVAWLGDASGRRLHDLAWARDEREVTTERTEKSIGHERTFADDLTDPADVKRELLRLSGHVGERLRRAGLQTRTVSIKVRFGDFSTVTRSRTLAEPTDLGHRIFEQAKSLYDALGKDAPRIRLVGVRAEQLVDADAAAGLWDDDADWRDAEAALDAVSERFGGGAVRPASLIAKPAEQRWIQRDELE